MLPSNSPDSSAVLLIGLDSDVLSDVIAPLKAAGYSIRLGAPADMAGGQYRLVISAPAIPGLGAMDLLAAICSPGQSVSSRLLVVGSTLQFSSSTALTSATSDGVSVQRLLWPFRPSELVERVQEMLRTKELDQDHISSSSILPQELQFSLVDEHKFLVLLAAERADQLAGRSPGESFVVSIRLDEFDRYRERLAPGAVESLWCQVAELIASDALADEKVAMGAPGDLLLLLPSAFRHSVARRLDVLSALMATHQFQLLGQSVQFTPVIGYAAMRGNQDGAQALAHARQAAAQATTHLDLQPVLYMPGRPSKVQKVKLASDPSAWIAGLRRLTARHALLLQYALTTFIGLVVPFFIYWGLGSSGFDISRGVYIFVVVSLVLTALGIWAEGLLAMQRVDPPGEPAKPYPPASAIIAAYLPNEAPIIEETVQAFLRVQYPAPLQIILAYNTPEDMPEIEGRLSEIARANPRFVPMRIRESTSKAQNVNVALASATGKFTAVFDADHQPDPESFRRAWRWLSHGADVVQGHCFIRNGNASWVARMVAVEFEQIYAVSHPGRARLHGFGIFGGSNGYWHTKLLRELRMHGFMLTEDIDSSMRALLRGKKIVSDPYLVSRELAPETLSALTKQRLRWAQGWFQISMKWVVPSLRSNSLTVRQKLGMLHLLAWREVYPWVSIQILPLIAYWAVKAGGLSKIEWFVPLFIVTTLFTLSTGPGQILFVYKLADPQIKKNTSWFWFFMLVSTLFYAGLKNAWGRISHLKEALGEKTWVVTTRAKPPPN